MRISRLALAGLVFSLSLPSCATDGSDTAAGAEGDGASSAESDEEDLTSITARARTLRFKSMVYVRQGATDDEALSAVREQTQTAFGALRTAEVGVNSRELKDVSPETFTKTEVTVVDEAGKQSKMLRVEYSYTDSAVVPIAMARRSSLGLAVMGDSYQSQSSRILTECTENTDHDREFEGSIWYVFNPKLETCQDAIAAEQKAIDEARKALTDKTFVPIAEVRRLYRPVTMSLSAAKTSKGSTYPEYDRLYRGGVKQDRLVIGMVNGLLADWAAGEMKDTIDDDGYEQWFEGLREIFKARSFKLAKISPQEDLSKLDVNGKSYTGLSFETFMKWELDGTGFPAGVSSDVRRALRVAAGKKLAYHWLSFEAPVKVTIGSEAPRDVVIELDTYFGAGSSSTPHKQAIKNSDVFIYNGHSYIGYGPLDPSRFSAGDFPPSYQIMFVDGCVSYNYYHKDYIPLKEGGTQNLDLVTNGLEAPSWRSAWALGRFVATLINGQNASYKTLLEAAEVTDNLRVVDGEVDNKFKPSKVKVTVQ